MSKVRDEALLRLKNRAARLQRLIALEAPDLILINEARLVADAAEMLDPRAWHNHAARRAVQQHKHQLHLCEEDGCEEPVAWIPSAETPTCPGPFHATSCQKHAVELEAETPDSDEAFDEETS